MGQNPLGVAYAQSGTTLLPLQGSGSGSNFALKTLTTISGGSATIGTVIVSGVGVTSSGLNVELVNSGGVAVSGVALVGSALSVNVAGGTVVANGAMSTSLNITALTVVKSGAGTLYDYQVVVAGTTVGKIYDVNNTGGVAASNTVVSTPTVVGGGIVSAWPMAQGIVVSPGSGQTVAVAFT